MLFLVSILRKALVTGEESSTTAGEWMERLRRRDPNALRWLYDRYSRPVYALILRIVRDPGTAEDLVQETFLRVWNRAHLYQPGKGSAGAWLMTVARRQAIDYLRSAEGQQQSASSFAQSEATLDLQAPPGDWRASEDMLLNAREIGRIRDAFGRLDENHRLVLELAYFEGLTQTEMAARTRQPLGTIKTWVRLGLRALRKELGEGGEGEALPA